MGLSRRHLICGAAASAASTLANSVRAQTSSDWPSARPIRIIVGYPAGQNADVSARTYAHQVSRTLGQSIVVENRPGANGLIGAQEGRNAKPDGYTWLWGGSGPLAINPSLYRKPQYDPVKDFKAVCLTTLGPLFLLAHPSFHANSFVDLVIMSQQAPNGLDYATAGNGSTAHLAMKLLEAQSGMKLNHIPYKGSPAALNDLASGQIQLMMEAGSSSLSMLRSGRAKSLGMTGRQRSPFTPQVPTLSEQGLTDFEAYAWNGIVVPAATPDDIVERIAAAVAKALEATSLKDDLVKQGTQQAWLPPREFATFLAAEVQKWRRAVQLSGAQLD